MSFCCLFGFHDYGEKFNHRGGNCPNSALLFFALIFDPQKYDRKCKWCGKVKTYIEEL